MKPTPRSDELALRYNDRAPLENHHCAAAFLLLRRPEYAFMAHLPKADTDRLRKMVRTRGRLGEAGLLGRGGGAAGVWGLRWWRRWGCCARRGKGTAA